MAHGNAESLANRDAPIPVVQVQHTSNSSTPTTNKPPSHRLSASKLMNKLESLGDNMTRDSTSRMGDKMMNLYVPSTHNVSIKRIPTT